MKRTPIVAVLLAGLAAAGCGASSSAPSPTSTVAATANVTPREWLASNAAHWNNQLNKDQNDVDSAAGTTSGVSSSTYFKRLTSVCTKLQDHAQQAMGVSKAPTASLQSAWDGMLAATEVYASKCLQLAHSHSASDSTAWQNTLTTMNTANDNFNRSRTPQPKPRTVRRRRGRADPARAYEGDMTVWAAVAIGFALVGMTRTRSGSRRMPGTLAA